MAQRSGRRGSHRLAVADWLARLHHGTAPAPVGYTIRSVHRGFVVAGATSCVRKQADRLARNEKHSAWRVVCHAGALTLGTSSDADEVHVQLMKSLHVCMPGDPRLLLVNRLF